MSDRKQTETVKNTVSRESEKKVKEFSKEQLIHSERYKNRRDMLHALLDSNKKYTIEAVDKMIDRYMKGQVK